MADQHNPGAVFRAALGACGLSLTGAADFLDVSDATVSAWVRNRRPVPPGVWRELSELHCRMATAARARVVGDNWPADSVRATVAAMVALATGRRPGD